MTGQGDGNVFALKEMRQATKHLHQTPPNTRLPYPSLSCCSWWMYDVCPLMCSAFKQKKSKACWILLEIDLCVCMCGRGGVEGTLKPQIPSSQHPTTPDNQTKLGCPGHPRGSETEQKQVM